MGCKCSKDKEYSFQNMMPNQAQTILSESKEDSTQLLEMYQHRLELKPEDGVCHKEIAALLWSMGRREEGEQHYRKAFELGQKSPGGCYALSCIEDQRGNPREQEYWLKECLKINPEHYHALGKLGEMSMQRNQFTKAKEYLEKALDIKPNSAEINNNYGLCFLNSQDVESAIDHFRKALAFDPTFARAHNNLGNALRKEGRIHESLKHYKLATQYQNKSIFAIAHLNMAAAYFDLDEVLSALRHLEVALSTGPSIHNAIVQKGYHLIYKDLRVKQGVYKLIFDDDIKESIKLLESAYYNDSTNFIGNYFLGLAKEKLGDFHAAKFFYNNTIHLSTLTANSNKHFISLFVDKTRLALDRLQDLDDENIGCDLEANFTRIKPTTSYTISIENPRLSMDSESSEADNLDEHVEDEGELGSESESDLDGNLPARSCGGEFRPLNEALIVDTEADKGSITSLPGRCHVLNMGVSSEKCQNPSLNVLRDVDSSLPIKTDGHDSQKIKLDEDLNRLHLNLESKIRNLHSLLGSRGGSDGNVETDIRSSDANPIVNEEAEDEEYVELSIKEVPESSFNGQRDTHRHASTRSSGSSSSSQTKDAKRRNTSPIRFNENVSDRKEMKIITDFKVQ